VSSLAKRNEALGYSGKGIKPPKPFKIKKVSIQPADQNPMELAELGPEEPLLENINHALALPREPRVPDLPLKEPNYINERHVQPDEPVSMRLLREPTLHPSELTLDNYHTSDPAYNLPPAEPEAVHSDRPLHITMDHEPEPSEH
jgi:hypothetical protein